VDLFDAVRDLLPGRAGVARDKETFEYRCRDCDAEFASPQRHVTAASCPDCGSEDVRVGEDPY
jgi:Zn finger protein HypA/HybF involved in hydrogenase expression